MNIDFITLLVLSLAIWRVASLFANEEGPFRVFSRVRLFLGETYFDGKRTATTMIGRGIMCVWCFSTQLGILVAIAYMLWGPIILWFTFPFALSAGAILIEQIVDALDQE